MDNPMADGNQMDFLRASQPIARFLGSGGKIRNFFRPEGLIDQYCLVGTLSSQARPGSDAVHLTFDEAIELVGRTGREDLKFEARRAGIDHKNCVHGLHTAATVAF
jgi:hypothetical protein